MILLLALLCAKFNLPAMQLNPEVVLKWRN